MNKPLRHLLLLFVSACTSSPDDGTTTDCDQPQMVYPDGDGDSYGDDSGMRPSCDVPTGFVARGGDCADDNAAVHPDSKEICDTIDNNCDGKIDDADPNLDVASATVFYRDGDSDGFGELGHTAHGCVKPVGYATSSSDCDDTRATVHPGAAEICDHLDNDCDSLVDMADPGISDSVAFYRDADHDSHGAGAATYACDAPSGYIPLNHDDCNDGDATSYPGAAELCDAADNDCDGGIDGTPAAPNRCAGLVGTYSGSYTHLTQEKLGSTVINSMSCTGTGSASLVLTRKPGLQGSFTCVYSGGLGGFDSTQHVTLNATVGLDGTVKGTVDHVYDSFDSQHRIYNVTGTQTGSTLVLSGTGSWYPNPQSAVPWTVQFSFNTSR